MVTELPYDSAIPLLGIHQEKNINWKDICTSMFSWQHSLQQLKHRSNQNVHQQRNTQGRCGTHIQWNITQSLKKEWNNGICSNKDGLRDYQTKWSKSEKEIQISYNITHMWNLTFIKDRSELFTKQKQIYRLKTNLWLPKGKPGGEG